MTVSCVTTPKPPVIAPNDVIITCVHKYDSNRVVKYVKGTTQRTVINDVITFYILDINGKDVFLNIYEIENYNCTDNGEIL